jgi:hypothetical protein
MFDINAELKEWQCQKPFIEYWEPFPFGSHTLPAEVYYFAGGPSTSNWILPGQEYDI